MAIDDVGQIHDPADIIVVPDLSPFELVALARKRLQPTRFDPEFLGWNFIRGSSGRVVEVRTRCFEVVTWTPKRRVETPEIIDQFRRLGADGNTGVFLSWITQKKPSGYLATIPSKDFCYRDLASKSDKICIPYFYNDAGNCLLTLDDFTGTWSDDWTLVACREVTAPFSSTLRL